MDKAWLGIDGYVVIVTGGASGIGRHVATTLKDAGATPVIFDVSVATGDGVEGIYCVKCDITSRDNVEAAVQHVIDKYGKIDALVNNAGVNMPRLLVDKKGERPEYELDERAFDVMFNINVKGLMFCTQACVRQMLVQGKGVIVNMSSESGEEGSQGQSAYNEALAYTRGVKPEDLSTDYSKVIPLGCDGKLDEVGNLVACSF